MIYNKIVHDYFFSPRHAGTLDLNQPLTVVFKNNQKSQGAIELYIRCRQDGVVEHACFKTNGNPYLIASMEWLCIQIEGQTVSALSVMDYQQLVKELAIPTAQYPLALSAITALKEVLILMNYQLNT